MVREVVMKHSWAGKSRKGKVRGLQAGGAAGESEVVATEEPLSPPGWQIKGGSFPSCNANQKLSQAAWHQHGYPRMDLSLKTQPGDVPYFSMVRTKSPPYPGKM